LQIIAQIENLVLPLFAAQQRNLLAVLAETSQRVTKVSFCPLLLEILVDQLAADEMADHCADERVDQTDPECP
jgi:hypothetical protein